eukprot:scaffold221846_cov15-Tisochrysis_lutea.AAC.1
MYPSHLFNPCKSRLPTAPLPLLPILKQGSSEKQGASHLLPQSAPLLPSATPHHEKTLQEGQLHGGALTPATLLQ